ncbi:hypothetical protein ALC60_07428 [Trachymyrmex zeteki]|uniref:Uncharacterized protein n=1 Tax=Mycetomoellerius zeteki TaxID=64791 RepID=A0A151WZV4_9HYME|nr:hypothetical protein ALC60_07428 [Trachymyrmex zeteki]
MCATARCASHHSGFGAKRHRVSETRDDVVPRRSTGIGRNAGRTSTRKSGTRSVSARSLPAASNIDDTRLDYTLPDVAATRSQISRFAHRFSRYYSIVDTTA